MILKNWFMVKHDDLVVMRAIALCFKPFLKPEEAMIYTNLGRTQFARKCEDYLVFKNESGYFKKEDLDRMMSGKPAVFDGAGKGLR